MTATRETVVDPAVAAAWDWLRLVVTDVETTGLALQDRVIADCVLDAVDARVKPRPLRIGRPQRCQHRRS